MRLITNLSFIQLRLADRPLVLQCRALLLEEQPPVFTSEVKPRQVLRGFGTSGDWPVFTYLLNCHHLDYQLVDAEGNIIIVEDSNPEGNPVFAGAILKFEDGTEMFLQLENQGEPFDILDLDDFETAWRELEIRVRRYYQALGFPVLDYVELGTNQR